MLPVLSQSEADLTACFVQKISAVLAAYSEKAVTAKESLQQILSSDGPAFRRAALQILAAGAGSAGPRYIVHLLRKHNLLNEALADSRGSKREVAIAAAREIARIGAPIEADLERLLGSVLCQVPSASNSSRVLRLLDVLEAASAQPRFNLYQTELLTYPDSAVRSRAALLIARTSRSAALVGRLLLDSDARVQANAVEALWDFEAEDARPLLENAARSKIARVAGNAAVGLYRIGDLSSFPILFSMAQRDDPALRISGAWAMGETGDTRFLPFLTAWFPRSSGNERVNVLQALGRIRRREKSLGEAGTLQIRTWAADATGPHRRLVFTLASVAHCDLSGLKSTQFAIWERDKLILDYKIESQPNPPVAISGFVLPRLQNSADPYGIAVQEGIAGCLHYKRPDDFWRFDRYLTEPRSDHGAAIEKAALPYDESVLKALPKAQQRGFLCAPESLRRILETPGPKERAADDSMAALDRQSDQMIKFSGKRTLFLFLSPECGRLGNRQIERLTSFVANERITVHGIAPKDGACEEIRALCLGSDGGTFAALAPQEIPEEVERIYAQSLNCYEIRYDSPDGQAEIGDGSIQITTNSGSGRTSFTLREPTL
jgi:HEAT repeat protein